jgi:hypothetical protein
MAAAFDMIPEERGADDEVVVPPVVVLPGVVVVVEEPSSVRALFSMYPPLVSRARQPVTVTSCALSVVLLLR